MKLLVRWRQAPHWLLTQACRCGVLSPRYAELFNKSGHPVRIENCHNSYGPDADGSCPMNFYRSGGDIHPGFIDVLGKVYGTVDFNDRAKPASFPGCWAYPDMSEVGNFCRDGQPCPDTEANAEQTHWGLWSVVSSPLVLGFDMNLTRTMDRVWPIITNTEALAVNQAWAGHPGTLAKVYPMSGLAPVLENWCSRPGPDGDTGCRIGLQAGYGQCDGSARTLGWKLDGGALVAPAGPGLATTAGVRAEAGPEQCLTYHNYQYDTDCPPPTINGGQVGCGLVIANCSRARFDGVWAHDQTTGAISFTPNASGTKQSCLSATPMDFNPSAGYYTRQGWKVSLEACPSGPTPAPNSSVFEFTAAGELAVGSGRAACLSTVPLNGPQLWYKPLGGGEVAALVVNPMVINQSDIVIPLSDIPGLGCSAGVGAGGTRDGGDGTVAGGSKCQVRDIWGHADASGQLSSAGLAVTLGGTGSAFLRIGPAP